MRAVRSSSTRGSMTYSSSLTPPAIADSATRSQWLTRDAAACLAIRNHLPLAECAHFGQHKTAKALYDAVVARYSSPATAALGRLILPYLFPELSAFGTVEDLATNLRTSDARYRTALPTEFLDRNPPPSLFTMATKPPQIAASAQVSTSGPVAPPSSYRLLSHQTLLWHHRLGHPSLPRLRGMHSRILVSGLLRSLPPLPPSPAPPCLPCVEGRQHVAPHSSSFPPTTAPVQTLHMDV
ncbi:unnamed protein product [Closterium sp. NIES-53]